MVIIFNIVAYICLSNIDYSVIAYKKSMNSMNQSINSALGAIADIFVVEWVINKDKKKIC